MPSPTEITVNQLSRLIGTHDAPTIIDVRIDEDFELDPQILPTATRCSHTKIAELAPQLKDKKVIIYCQKGKKISQGSIAILRSLGVNAESVEGGHFGWRDAGQTLIPIDKIPSRNTNQQTIWVTKQRPKIDRIACPWLIRRFIDPNAQILFVAPSEVLGVAEKFNATPFDIEDVYFSHRGEFCTFDTMVEEFELQSPAILKLAEIVRGADTDRLDLAPESAGLLAASLGLSRMHRNDNEQLEAGMLLYDSFYRWARDASNESHDWHMTSNSSQQKV